MGKVRALTKDLVSLISAGEVVENPASVVKELIENSLDAGADMIEIVVEQGGIKKITVSDNGSGILKDDCKLCFHRYSTSKIRTREDLEGIATYGFRGEALASIASVADVRVTTQTAEEEMGTLVVSRFGTKPTYHDVSRPRGTTVEVEELFRNVAARRKHLEDAKTESQRIQEAIMKHAAIRPDVGFRLIRDGKNIIECPPAQNASNRIAMLWGHEIAKALVDVEYSTNEIRITGFVARPPVARGNRSREYFSLVKRPISDERLSRAVESAYSTTLMKGQFPICALDITTNLSRVDVNVHPTKREVRILDIDQVCAAIRNITIDALGPKVSKKESETLEAVFGKPVERSSNRSLATTSQYTIKPIDLLAAIPVVEQTLLGTLNEDAQESADVTFLGGVFKIVGQIHNLYILLEFDDGLLVVDQHAAHERILYERLRKDVNDGTVAVQELLQPFVLNLNQKDAEQILEIADILNEIGYTVSSFGGNEIAVSTLPEVFGRTTSEKELMSLVDRIVDLGRHQARDTFLDELVKLTACHSAVREGQPLDVEQMRNILLDLSKTKNKYNCCHGRPSMLKIMKEDIDRSVGRMGPEAIKRFRARH